MFLFCTLALAAEHTLAVVPFTGNTDDRDLAPLTHGLADMVTTDLGEAAAVELVERARLKSILDELALQQTDWADPASAVQLGKGVGATAVVVGALSESRGVVRLDARVVDVSSGRVVHAVEVEGETDAVFHLERQLCLRVLEALEVEITPEHRARLGALAPDSGVVGAGFDDNGPALVVTLLKRSPASEILIDGASVGLLERGLPVTTRVKPGRHEVALRAPVKRKRNPKKEAKRSKIPTFRCWGVLDVSETGVNLSRTELCDALQPGPSPFGTAIPELGVIQFNTGTGPDAADIVLDGKPLYGQGLRAVQPGAHTLVAYEPLMARRAQAPQVGLDASGQVQMPDMSAQVQQARVPPQPRVERCRQTVVVEMYGLSVVDVSPNDCTVTQVPSR